MTKNCTITATPTNSFILLNKKTHFRREAKVHKNGLIFLLSIGSHHHPFFLIFTYENTPFSFSVNAVNSLPIILNQQNPHRRDPAPDAVNLWLEMESQHLILFFPFNKKRQRRYSSQRGASSGHCASWSRRQSHLRRRAESWSGWFFIKIYIYIYINF